MRGILIFLGILLTSYNSVVEGHAVSGQLYSSLTHMNDLFIFDKMVGEMLLPFLPSYIPEVESYKESYDCLSNDTAVLGKGDVMDVAVTGNPLHLFSVIKRLVLYWPAIRHSISVFTDEAYNCIDRDPSCDWWAARSECEKNPSFMLINCQVSCELCGKPELGHSLTLLKELENRTVLPSANDMRGASLALARLQQVYRLPISDLAAGAITDVQTCVHLSVYDCMQIASESRDEGEYADAWQWYHYAAEYTRDPELKGLITSLINSVGVEHDAQFVEDVPQFFPKHLALEKMQIPWDTQYSQLCRGHRLMDEETLADLKCYISSRGSPYLILQPIKYDHVHTDPEMYLFYDVISDKEIQAVQGTAKDLLQRSSVLNSDRPVETRVSQTAWLYNQSHPYLPGIARRISAITDLHVFEEPEGQMAGEPLQVLSYGIGGHYNYHLDTFWKQILQEEDQRKTQEKYSELFDTGDRIATWMFYLSEVQAGGKTAFPHAGVSVEPVKGSAVFWYSVKRSGLGNRMSEHGGCPVLLGHKWVANKWIRENENFLRRPCSSDPME